MIKILAIDNENDSLNSLKAVIIQILPEALIFTASEVEPLPEQVIQHDPDIILMNLKKDSIQGCTLLKKDKRLNIIPVVCICPDRNDEKKRVDALKAGADALLTNPVDKIELLALLMAMKKVKDANVLYHEKEVLHSHTIFKSFQALQQDQLTALQLLDSLNSQKHTLVKAEELLFQSEQHYRNLFEANPNPMLIFNLETLRFLAVNERTIQHYGYSREEFHEMTICDIRPKEDIENFLEIVKGSKVGLRNVGVWRHKKKNNQIIWVEITSHPIMWMGQQAVVVLAHDITERKLAEEELNNSNEFNKTLLHAIPFGMQIVDEHGNILFVNEILERKLGIETIGKKCWTLFKDNKFKCPGCPLLSEITIGKTTVSESYDVFADRIFQISHIGMLFKGKKALLEIFQDITEHKRIEAELINAKEKAEESDQLKTSFLANMSHEIRTPLNSIIGFSEMLTDPDYDPTQQFHIARIIHASGNNLLSIINNILDISKLEAGQVQISKKLFTVNKLFGDLEKEYLFKSIEKGIDLIVDLPNSDEEVVILSDEGKIRQVLDNFISNSMKFTKRGYIRLRFKKYDNSVEFMVKDTGIGIAVEFHEKIFEHFRQVEAVNTKTHGGNGLGLAISKGLVNLLGGKIWMESEKGKGSAFYFSIPIH